MQLTEWHYRRSWPIPAVEVGCTAVLGTPVVPLGAAGADLGPPTAAALPPPHVTEL